MSQPTPRVPTTDKSEAPARSVRSLFDDLEGPLLRYAFSLTGRRAIAEEIVQDVFLQLHLHWERVDTPERWLYRSVRNRAFNHVRDRPREILPIDDREDVRRASSDMTPEQAMERLEATGAIRDSIRQLTESDQQLIRLKYFEGQSYRQISEATELSVGNVGYRLHHVLKTLAVKLGSLGIDNKP